MPLRATIAAALLAVSFHSAPATARERPRALTVTGNRTSYATVHVTERTTVRLDKATVVRRGGYGGLAIGYPQGFVISADDLATTHHRGTLVWQLSALILEPGTHRVYLVSDGAEVTVTLPWSARATKVTAVTPVDHAFEVRHRPPLPGSPWNEVIEDVGGPSDTHLFGVAIYESRQALPSDVAIRVCVTKRAASCDDAITGMHLLGEMTVNSGTVGVAITDWDVRGYHVRGYVERGGELPLDDLTVVALRLPFRSRV